MRIETQEVELSLEERLQLQSDLNPSDPWGPVAAVMCVPFFGFAGWVLLDLSSYPLRIAGFLCAGLASLAALGLVLMLFKMPLGRRALRKAQRARSAPESYRLALGDGVLSLVFNTGSRIDTPLSEARSHVVRGRRILVLAGGRIACFVPDRALADPDVRRAFDSVFGSLQRHGAANGK